MTKHNFLQQTVAAAMPAAVTRSLPQIEGGFMTPITLDAPGIMTQSYLVSAPAAPYAQHKDPCQQQTVIGIRRGKENKADQEVLALIAPFCKLIVIH